MPTFENEDLIIKRDGNATARIDGTRGNLLLGGGTTDGYVAMFPKGKQIFGSIKEATVQLLASSGRLILGGGGRDGNLEIFNKHGQLTIFADGDAGDISLGNADCAEEFDIAEQSNVEAGTVVCLDSQGQLRAGNQPYDKKVAGVISGAGDYKPGIILDQRPSDSDRKPVALMGKVFCKVDATFAPIEIGDLLTTSATEGHAMKATAPAQAFGSVIGKALGSLPEGIGLIPILVTLQ